MDATFIRHRISELRTKKGVSEYKMSADLGHSKSYIQSISSGKALPSMSAFFFICEYLDISPGDFFDTASTNPEKLNTLIELLKKLNDKQLDSISAVVSDMIK